MDRGQEVGVELVYVCRSYRKDEVRRTLEGEVAEGLNSESPVLLEPGRPLLVERLPVPERRADLGVDIVEKRLPLTLGPLNPFRHYAITSLRIVGSNRGIVWPSGTGSNDSLRTRRKKQSLA